MEVCENFICRYNIDDLCNDNVLCGDCLYCDCDNCVYHTRISDFAEYCSKSDDVE